MSDAPARLSEPIGLSVLLQGQVAEDQLGYHTAFQDAASTGQLRSYRAFPYRGLTSRAEWDRLWDETESHMRDSRSNVLMLQYFHLPGAPDPRPRLRRIRDLPQRPIIAVSCGDGFGMRGEPPPRSLLQAASVSDVVMSTSLGRLARIMVRAGAIRIVLVPHAACHIRFGTQPEPLESDPPDVVFVGNRHGGRNFYRYLWHSGRERARAVDQLARRYGKRFGLYGAGWSGNPSWRGPVPFDLQASACAGSQVVFGGHPGSWCDFYTSDRPFIQATSGVPIVDLRVPGVDFILQSGVEWILANDVEHALASIDGVLAGTIPGQAIGGRGATAATERHLSTHRVQYSIQIFEALARERETGRPARPPVPPFLHTDVNHEVFARTRIGW